MKQNNTVYAAAQVEEDGEVHESCNKSWKGLQILDFVNGMLSLVGLIVFVVIISTRDGNSTTIHMSKQLMTFRKDYNFVAATDTLNQQVKTATCSNSSVIETGYKLYLDDQKWVDVFRGIPLLYESGRSFDQAVLVGAVLLISCMFQFGRAFIPTYDPGSGPDAWRWLEYALTAPLQIIIIASALFQRDLHFLLIIANLQCALVVLGYLLELKLAIICDIKCVQNDGKMRAYQDDTDTFAYAVIKVWLIFIATCMFHVSIWWAVINKFLDAPPTFTTCTHDNGPPPWLEFILYGQCACFSLFGLVMLVHILIVCLAEFNDKTDVEWTWKVVTWMYSIISVVAKLLLEYGFVGLIFSLSTV